MKGLNDDDGNGNMNNWLGFSLSPHMKMEAQNHNHHHHFTESPPTSYLTNSPHHVIYGLAENNDFHSPLSVMPLKSDGSLCIMEALTRSHSQGHVVASSSPKLEDFLGGATMATHQYSMHPRDHAMVLSLDSAFYNQEPFRQHPAHYYPAFFNGVYQTPNEEQASKQAQILTPIPDEEIPCFKTWMDHHHAVLEQQQQINNTSTMVEERSGHLQMGCNDLQSLTLSMSPGSQSSCVTASRQISPTENTDSVTAMGAKKRGAEKLGQKPTVHRKSIDTFGQRTSQYRGVTRHRWTGRYEAHLWDNSCKKEGQTRKGRQVYLGGYDMEEKAARAYDLAALKYWGPSTHINFALENYHQELEDMKNMSRQEYVAHLRRKSSGFSRGASIYRGVTRHHQHGRWQARIGRVAGNKDLYLGTFSTQEEAAEAYDIAAIKFRGVNAVTNFDISRYDVEKIMASNTLPTGEIARRTKPTPEVIVECNPTAQMEGDWKMVLNNEGDVKNHGSYQSPAYSVALHDLIGLESSHNVVDEPASAMAPHFSNASSLVTSLNSSREGSPDKYGVPAMLAKPNSANVGSWIPTAQLRPGPIATGHHLPVFAAWNDA